METAVRYFSVLGNTKAIAEEIAAGVGVPAISITDEPELAEHVDVLFLGGAPYANIMAPELRAYAEQLDPSKVGKVILFSTSNWSRRTVLALRKIIKAKGIPVVAEHFWAHMTRIAKSKPAARSFGSASAPVAASEAIDRQAVVAETISSIVIVASIAILAHVIVRSIAKQQ